MINYLTLRQGSKVISEECNTGLKPYPCHMHLLYKNLSVIVFWLTFTQPQQIGWLADWLTDFSAYQLTDQLTGLLFQLLTGWLTDWLTDCVADRMVDLLATILSQIVEKKPVFLEFFGKFCTFTLLTFVLTQICPSPSPMLSHTYFGALRRR